MSDIVLKLKPSERRALVQSLREFSQMSAEGDSGVDPLIEVMNKLAGEAADEIENLAERLEVTHVWRGIRGTDEFERIDMPDDDAHWDGIACRDLTIKEFERK